MNRRRVAIGVSSVSGLAVVAAGAMSMAGSGGSAKSVDLHTTPVAAVSDSAALTVRAATARTDTVVTVASPAIPAHGKTPATLPQTLTMHGSGLFDLGKQVGSLDLTVPTGSFNEVVTPAMVWVRRAATVATPTAAAIPASAWSQTATAKYPDGDLFSHGTTEPSLVFAMLGGVQPGVREVGQDVVRGVPVVHYQGTLDLAKAAAALTGPASAAQKQSLENAAHAFLTTKVPFEAYLDAQGRLRRFVATFSFLEGGPSKPVGQVTSATELYAFGTPVTVVMPSAPSPAQTSPEHRSTTPSAHTSSPTRPHK